LKCSDGFTDREHEMAYLSLHALIAEKKQALLTLENEFLKERYEARKSNTDA